MAAGAAGVARADSELIFPRLSFGGNERTGIAIVNPNTTDALVTLTAYGADGQPLEADGFENPVEITVGAEEQFSLVAREIFGGTVAADDGAWIHATSESNDLAGFFLYLTLALNVFDGADLPERASSLVFSEVRVDAGFETELNLVNPNAGAAQVTLTLMGGAAPIVRQLALPARGTARLDAADLFGLAPAGASNTASARYVLAEANAEIAGFAFVQGAGDLLGLNARPADERLETIFFPQLAVLGPISTEVAVVNNSNQTVLVTLRARRPDGELYGPPDLTDNPVTRSLGAGEILRADLEELFGFTGNVSLEGWLEVVSSSEAISAALSYAIQGGSLASVAGLRGPSQQALFSHIATTQGFFTGLAMLNGSELLANVRVVAGRPDGTPLGSFATVLLPGQRISRLIDDLILDAGGQGGGFIWVSSDVPIFSTSLFGIAATGVLANIPPQPVPSSFRPDAGQPSLSLSPLLAILAPGASQEFSVEGAGGVSQWSVNSVPGGNASVGMVSATGFFTAPDMVPDDLPLSITADSNGSVVGGSVDVFSPENFLNTAGSVSSVAYLEGLQRVYYAELSILAGQGGSRPAGAIVSDSRIVEVVGRDPQTLVELPGDEVAEIVPFTATDGNDYLLVAASLSGRILRVDPSNGSLTEVASGLDQPAALVFDPIDSELLVADEGGVTAIGASALNVGLENGSVPLGPSANREDFLDAPRGRLAVNQCNGNVYLSLEDEGQVLEYVRLTGALRVLVDGLDRPGSLLALYRKGVGCPEAFHLLVPERGANRILLIVPELDLVRPWLELAGVTDLTLIPPNSPLAPGGGVLIAGSGDGDGGEISLVRFPGLYRGRGFNPPGRPERPNCQVGQLTETQGSDVRFQRLAGNTVFFVSSEDLTGENPDGSDEIFSATPQGGLTQWTGLERGEIRDLAVNTDGTRLAFVTNAPLVMPDPPGEDLFLMDLVSGVLQVVALTPEGPPAIDGSGELAAVASRDDPLGTNPDGNVELFLVEEVDVEGEVRLEIVQVTQTNQGGSRAPSLSEDGSTVAFRSNTNLTGQNPDGGQYVFVYRRFQDQFFQLALEDSSPQPGNDDRIPLDGTGSRLVFVSSEDLTGENPPGGRAIFLADLLDGTVTQLLTTKRQVAVRGISRDGNFVVGSANSNPVGLNKDRNVEVFLFDLADQRIFQLTRSRDALNVRSELSPDATTVSILSNADYVGRNPDGNFEAFMMRCR